MKRFAKTLLASAAVLVVASMPALAGGPGFFGGPGGGCPGYSEQRVVEKLKLTADQKKAFDAYQKVAQSEREERWSVRDAMDPKAIEAMTPEEFRQHQADMSKARIDSMTKIFEARQKFLSTLTDEQKKQIGDGFGFGPNSGPRGRNGGWMM